MSDHLAVPPSRPDPNCPQCAETIRIAVARAQALLPQFSIPLPPCTHGRRMVAKQEREPGPEKVWADMTDAKLLTDGKVWAERSPEEQRAHMRAVKANLGRWFIENLIRNVLAEQRGEIPPDRIA